MYRARLNGVYENREPMLERQDNWVAPIDKLFRQTVTRKSKQYDFTELQIKSLIGRNDFFACRSTQLRLHIRGKNDLHQSSQVALGLTKEVD